MDKLPCPKCKSNNTWLEWEEEDLVLRCLCGVTKYLQRRKGDMTIMATVTDGRTLLIPAQGTKLHRAMGSVMGAHPTAINTATIAGRAGLQLKETASLLVMLMARGIIERVEERRGLAGGSVWKLSQLASEVLAKEAGG